jgi:hypothetical protein
MAPLHGCLSSRLGPSIPSASVTSPVNSHPKSSGESTPPYSPFSDSTEPHHHQVGVRAHPPAEYSTSHIGVRHVSLRVVGPRESSRRRCRYGAKAPVSHAYPTGRESTDEWQSRVPNGRGRDQMPPSPSRDPPSSRRDDSRRFVGRATRRGSWRSMRCLRGWLRDPIPSRQSNRGRAPRPRPLSKGRTRRVAEECRATPPGTVGSGYYALIPSCRSRFRCVGETPSVSHVLRGATCWSRRFPALGANSSGDDLHRDVEDQSDGLDELGEDRPAYVAAEHGHAVPTVVGQPVRSAESREENDSDEWCSSARRHQEGCIHLDG